MQPDVIVTRFTDLTPKNLPVAPSLAVEVLSRSTRLVDRNLKKAHYERIGVPSFWILDPAEPGALIVFELDAAGATCESRTSRATTSSSQPGRSRSPSSPPGCSTGCGPLNPRAAGGCHRAAW